MTDAERKLWYRLRAHRFNGVSFRRQVPIGPFIPDFVCMQARLIVEIDGGQHGTAADDVRDAWLRGQGFRLLRFRNNDVLSNLDGVLQVVAETLAQATPPSLTLPRKGGGDYTGFAESKTSGRNRGATFPLAGEVGGEAAGRGARPQMRPAEKP